jgi:hypothetical protein
MCQPHGLHGSIHQSPFERSSHSPGTMSRAEGAEHTDFALRSQSARRPKWRRSSSLCRAREQKRVVGAIFSLRSLRSPREIRIVCALSARDLQKMKELPRE